MNDRARLIALENVGMIRSRRVILENVDLTVDKGDFIAITGPNGGGKTTLLRIILRLLTPTSGKVTYFDAPDRVAARLSVGYLPQKNMIDSSFPITVREVVSLGISGLMSMSKANVRELVNSTIEKVGLTSHADSILGSLSGGQLQRALMARAIISRPSVLVLDEPLSYVDRQFERRIYDIVAEMAPTTTILLVSHDMSTIASMANRHIIVNRSVGQCKSGSHFIHYDCCDSAR